MPADHLTGFARIDFHSDDRVFGIKDEDRLLHMYVIGKTGTGKSTLLENMALQDLVRGNGFALIDPHGDPVARNAERVYVSMLTTTVDDQEPQLLTQEIACDTEATIYSKTRSPFPAKRSNGSNLNPNGRHAEALAADRSEAQPSAQLFGVGFGRDSARSVCEAARVLKRRRSIV